MENRHVSEVNSRPWWDEYFQKKWDFYGGGAQTRYFMQTVLVNLPETERAYLLAGGKTILDWGCAFGEGVAALAQAFPECRVAGLDFAQQAIEEAGVRNAGHEFIWTEDGRIPRDFDVIVTSNCLEHFEQPLAAMEKHLASCKGLYIILVPYNECPLHPQHRAQFRAESFPYCIRDFTRIHTEPLVVDQHFWPGQQILVIYASAGYLQQAVNRPDSIESVIAKLADAQLAASRKASEAEAGLEAERQRSAALEVQAAALLSLERQRADVAEATLLGAETLRRRTAKGLKEYHSQFAKQLSAYQVQRAWRIMLAFRKAYTALARGKTEALTESLDKFELTFPNLLNFVPDELFAPSAATMRPPPRADRKYDVVVLPIFDFEFRFQRPQQMAVQFARSGHRVFWISPIRLLAPTSPAPYESVALRENVWEIRLRGTPFDLYRGALEPSQAASFRASLDHLFRDLEIAASCVVLQFPFWRQIGLALRESFGTRVVYDCMDDWQNWPTEPLPGEFSLAEERKLVAESDVLVVTSRALHERHAANGIASQLIPNAADFDFFRHAPAGSHFARLPRPVVGYFGAIADWFDLELMIDVIRSRPQYSFVIIGQVHLSEISALKALPNAHLLGEKEYRELPGYLREFDVCTLPFRLNRLTRAVDPVKVYEYLSQGKPVVSTPLPELAPLSDLLYFAEGPGAFAAQIDCAVAERDESLRRKRIEFASVNTWKSRMGQLDAAIRATFPPVSILVVTYNTREYLAPFLDSVRRNTSYPCYEVVVVDNHSTDGSDHELRRYAASDERIRVECLDRNLGFAGGNNHAARMAKGEYLVLLNPDTIVTAGWLERLMEPMLSDLSLGMVAPVSNFSGNETKVNTSYRSFRQMEEFAAGLAKSRRSQTLPVGVVPLFCGLLPRKLWDETGGLDEGFEVGTFEDDDFSLRIRNAGYGIVTAEDCFIHHFGNGSFGKLESAEFLRIFDKNKKRFETKWGTPWTPHKTRPGVRPISEDSRIPVTEFFSGDADGEL